MKRFYIILTICVFGLINLKSYASLNPPCEIPGTLVAMQNGAEVCCFNNGTNIDFTVNNTPNVWCPATILWLWDFGDGSTPVWGNSSISHQYLVPGTYNVKVVTADVNQHQFSTVPAFTLTITIQNVTDCPSCPVIHWDYNKVDCNYLYVSFVNGTVFPSCNSSLAHYTWDFGDPASGPINNTSTTANPSHVFTHPGNFTVILWIIIPGICQISKQYTINVSSSSPQFPYPQLTFNNPTYIGLPVTFNFAGNTSSSATINFGDGVTTSWNLATPISHTYNHTGIFHVFLTLNSDLCPFTLEYIVEILPTTKIELPCFDCIGSFSPEPGKKYIASAWVREDGAGPTNFTFTNPTLRLIFISAGNIHTALPDMLAEGDVIDGWQRIEGEFTVPSDAVNMIIKLNCNSGNCLFDDVRVFPYDGTMKSYVYDPVTLKLAAELDERNYATLYEYDEEGKLIRVKKETERGVMTIKESRNHTSVK
jgi:PKD repeat protein